MIEEEEQEQFHLLVTRAKEYDLHEGQVSASTPKPKLLKRNATFVKCREHVNLTNTRWETVNEDCNMCMNFEVKRHLKNGLLPRGKDVLEYLLTIKADNSSQHDINNERQCAMDIILQWIYCKFPLQQCVNNNELQYLVVRTRITTMQ